jgi:hypothetical protein
MSLSCFRINTCTSVDSKGLTTMLDFGALARYRRRSPLQKAGATKLNRLMQKENAATWLPQRRLYLVVPESDYSKIWSGLKRKENTGKKDNAETQSTLRFAEEAAARTAAF